MSPIPLGILAAAGAGGAGAFDLLASSVGDGSFSEVTFDNIPSGYSHLQLRWTAMQTSSSSTLGVRLNNDSGGNYTYQRIVGTGSVSTALFTGQTSYNLSGVNSSANVINTGYMDLLDFSHASKNTTSRTTLVDSNRHIYLTGGVWDDTSPVTSIKIFNNPSNNFTTQSVFSLYGRA